MRQIVKMAFATEVARYEGRTTWMYRDTHENGYITTGKGNLIDPVSLALDLPWLRADGELADEEEVLAEWGRVKAMPRGLRADRYRGPDGLRLSDEAVDDLVQRKLAEFWSVGLRYFPDAEEWPAPAQLGWLLMAWAMGPAFTEPTAKRKGWPKFKAACLALDWEMAAAECFIPGARDVRNEEHRRLFLAAASSTDPEALS
jgi:hypothetical protein